MTAPFAWTDAWIDAINASIRSWKRRAANPDVFVAPTWEACALCQLAYKEVGGSQKHICERCPVGQLGYGGCEFTPVGHYAFTTGHSPAARQRYAEAEVAFLERVRDNKQPPYEPEDHDS